MDTYIGKLVVTLDELRDNDRDSLDDLLVVRLHELGDLTEDDLDHVSILDVRFDDVFDDETVVVLVQWEFD